MSTEIECVESLGYIWNLAIDEVDRRRIPYEDLQKSVKVLQKLIEEHFDNLPLKFDELKEGMWVWDNKMVLYIRIAKIIGKTIYAEDFLYGFDCYGRYEKNRFYRKQVEE